MTKLTKKKSLFSNKINKLTVCMFMCLSLKKYTYNFRIYLICEQSISTTILIYSSDQTFHCVFVFVCIINN